MTDLVERVARALCKEYGDTPDCWDDHLPEAKVAIDIVVEEAANMVKASAIRSGGGIIAETLIKDIRAMKGKVDD